MSQVWTVLSIIQWTTEFFDKHGVDTPRLDAELLLARVLDVERIQLYVQFQRPLDSRERGRFRTLVKRRARGEPVQYILGQQEFWSIPFEVRAGVLIPRADTEVLVEEALALARTFKTDLVAADDAPDTGAALPLRIADVGTGSGAIAVALASELPAARVWAGDIADGPLELAPKNAAAAGVHDRVQVTAGPGLAPLWEAAGRAPFHIVASNPPYIRAADYPTLMREVRDWEPREALVAGADGNDVIRHLVSEAARPGRLHPDGALLIEIGDAQQAAQTQALCAAQGLVDTRIRQDLAGRPRVVVARRQSR